MINAYAMHDEQAGAGTGRATAFVPPNKVTAEQLVHPAPPIFSVTY